MESGTIENASKIQIYKVFMLITNPTFRENPSRQKDSFWEYLQIHDE
jgi:hypothetical protein